eukprot:TRINITY_DN2269_c0_g1_i1.p1 TRINITY_DN2269_c0_g1~~TRINITY_DN2269_c0_g1_i1.p1  ORF type:complete len:389 (+),score=147.01 TRINITY_DN2269_c0_g1_i1:43-1167(+)
MADAAQTPAGGPNEDPNAAGPASPVSQPSPVRAGRLKALLTGMDASGTVGAELTGVARRRLAEVTRMRSETGTLQRLQMQLGLVKTENEMLRRLLNRGMVAVEREHSERSLEYDNLAKEKSELEEKLREALTEVEFHQGDVRLAFSEAKRVGLQNVHLLKVLDEKEAVLEELRGQLAMSDYSHRHTIDMLEQSESTKKGMGKDRLRSGQECSELRERLAKVHAKVWRLEHDNELLRDEVTDLRRQSAELQSELAVSAAWGSDGPRSLSRALSQPAAAAAASPQDSVSAPVHSSRLRPSSETPDAAAAKAEWAPPPPADTTPPQGTLPVLSKGLRQAVQSNRADPRPQRHAQNTARVRSIAAGHSRTASPLPVVL